MSLWWGLQEGPEEDSEDWVVEAELEAVEMFIVTRRERERDVMSERWDSGDGSHWPLLSLAKLSLVTKNLNM